MKKSELKDSSYFFIDRFMLPKSHLGNISKVLSRITWQGFLRLTNQTYNPIYILGIVFLLTACTSKSIPIQNNVIEISIVNETVSTISIPIPSISIKPKYEINVPLLIDFNVDTNKLDFLVYETEQITTYKNSMVIKENKHTLKSVKDLNLNPIHVKGLKYVRIVDSGWGNCGDYVLDYGFHININGRCDSLNKSKVFLHEDKHHYCWFEKKETTITHEGCFLNTPIDKEYGFINKYGR